MKHRAFTLIELLVATAIAAMLMVAVLKVTVSLGQTQKALTADTDFPLHQAATWIECDLAMSESVTVEQDALVIQTLQMLEDTTTSGARHRRSTVRYYLLTTPQRDTGKLWVREQIDPAVTTGPMRTDVLASGVESLRLTTTAPSSQSDATDKQEIGGLLIELTTSEQPDTPHHYRMPWRQ